MWGDSSGVEHIALSLEDFRLSVCLLVHHFPGFSLRHTRSRSASCGWHCLWSEVILFSFHTKAWTIPRYFPSLAAVVTVPYTVPKLPPSYANSGHARRRYTRFSNSSFKKQPPNQLLMQFQCTLFIYLSHFSTALTPGSSGWYIAPSLPGEVSNCQRGPHYVPTSSQKNIRT